MKRNKYTADLSVVHSCELSDFRLRFLIQELNLKFMKLFISSDECCLLH